MKPLLALLQGNIHLMLLLCLSETVRGHVALLSEAKLDSYWGIASWQNINRNIYILFHVPGSGHFRFIPPAPSLLPDSYMGV